MYTLLVIGVRTLQLDEHGCILDSFQTNVARLVHMLLSGFKMAQPNKLCLGQAAHNVAFLQLNEFLIC